MSYSCPKGKHISASASYCIGCGQGKYQNQEDQQECKTCPGGKFQGDTSQEDCKICAAGKFQDQEAQLDCKTCTRGTYSDIVGQQDCLDCVSVSGFSYQDKGGHIRCETCACNTNNAMSGFGQRCPISCDEIQASVTFIADFQGTGFAGKLSQTQLVQTQDVLVSQLNVTKKENAQIYLQSLKAVNRRRLASIQSHIYEAAVFEPLSFEGTLTNVEDRLKAEITSTVAGIVVHSFRAIQTEEYTTGEETEAGISTSAYVGIGIGASLLAAVPIFRAGVGTALKGGKAVGNFAAKRTKSGQPPQTQPIPEPQPIPQTQTLPKPRPPTKPGSLTI